MRRLGLGRTVRLRFEGRDENGDMVGRLWLSDYANLARAPRDLGVELVRTGLARMEGDGGAYKYGELAAAEAFARSQNLGLWKSEKEGRP
jgi:endonuclease YncB( thermonuclease family)